MHENRTAELKEKIGEERFNELWAGPDIEMYEPVLDMIREAPNSELIGPYLNQHPEICNSFGQMTETQAKKAINDIGEWLGRHPEALEAAPSSMPRAVPAATASPSVAQAPLPSDAAQVEEALAAHSRRMAREVAKMPREERERILSAMDIPAPQWMMLAVTQLPNSEKVLLHLADHPEKARHLAQLALSNDPQTQQAAFDELQRMSAGLDYAREHFSRPVRQAPRRSLPEPIRPLGGNGMRPAVDLNDPDIPYQEFKAVREKQSKAWRSGVRR